MRGHSRMVAVILAAGKGTRMDLTMPKPLVRVGGKPILRHIIHALNLSDILDIVIVVGHQEDRVKTEIGKRYRYVLQSEQKGMAHAVAQAGPLISRYDQAIVFVGDSPLIEPDSIRLLIRRHTETKAACSFLTAVFPIRYPYARVVRDHSGKVLRCVEERYATDEEIGIFEYLTSHYIFRVSSLLEHLNDIKKDPNTGEAYLADIVQILIRNGHRVTPVEIEDYRELVGVNTPEDLRWATKTFEDRHE